MPITVAREHSLGLDNLRSNVQQWLEHNWFWNPKVRINHLRYTGPGIGWNADFTRLKISGQVGETGYVFDAEFVLEPNKLMVTASDPPTVHMGAKAGWDDELKKILGVPNTLPPRTLIELPSEFSADVAKRRLGQWIERNSPGNTRWSGNRGFFFFCLKDPKTGAPRKSTAYWDQTQVPGILTVLPSKILLEVPQGAPEGRADRAKRWEQMLAGQLVQIAGDQFSGVGATGGKKPAAKKPVAKKPVAKGAKKPSPWLRLVQRIRAASPVKVSTSSTGAPVKLTITAAAIAKYSLTPKEVAAIEKAVNRKPDGSSQGFTVAEAKTISGAMIRIGAANGIQVPPIKAKEGPEAYFTRVESSVDPASSVKIDSLMVGLFAPQGTTAPASAPAPTQSTPTPPAPTPASSSSALPLLLLGGSVAIALLL